MTDYKKFINEKISIIAEEKDVLDIGGGGRFTKWLAEYKNLFLNTNYKTFDFDKSTGADIVGDIHKIPLKDGDVDAIICSSVLEHVENPMLAIKEMYRILKPSGKLFVYVPSIYPYHARKDHYSDYWRFFEDTLRAMLKDFSSVEIVKFGGYFMALSFFIPFQNKLRGVLNITSNFLDKIFKTKLKTTTAGYYIYAIK
ncbi:MAG: class I SAM-dependent methyltransferase [Minisyncoccota bacterium]